ncbi:MAG TPA: MFS transporter [Candidatus Hydrogenedentes bacterium]|nr:MFS transporter [Candidatus Hydrogenedentota bacterium]
MDSDRRRMYSLGLMAFILFLSSTVGIPVLPRIAAELEADPTEIPIVVAAALATVVVAQLFTGFLADRYSRKTLIQIGALMGSASSLLCVVATDWTQLAALRVIGGIADAVAMPALLAITASLGSSRPGKAFGILRSSQGLSFVIGPALGAAFSFVALRAPFVVDGLLSLGAFFASVVLLTDTDRVAPAHSFSVFRGLKSTFSDARVYLYLMMGISGIFGFGILCSFVPAKAQIIGLEAWQIGAILSGGALLFSVMSYVVGSVTDKYGRRIFVILSQALIIVAGVGLLFSNGFATLFLSYGIFCVAETITYLLSFVYASETFDKRHIGASVAVFDSLMDLSLLIGPLIAVAVHKSTGRLGFVFLIAVIPAATAFFATSVWLPREAKSDVCYDEMGEKP